MVYQIDELRGRNVKPHLQSIKGIAIVLAAQTYCTLVLKDNLNCDTAVPVQVCLIYVSTRKMKVTRLLRN